MKPVRTHHPAPPVDEEPPERLLALADGLRDPQVVQAGVTTTADGRWALYLTVPSDCDVPIARIERMAGGFPVVYEADRSPVHAGPAYPRRGG